MKESNHYKSRKYDKEMYRKRDEYETSDQAGSYEYKHALKEYHTKGIRGQQRSNERMKESHSKHASHSKKSKADHRSASPHFVRKNHQKNSSVKSNCGSEGEEQHKSRKHQNKTDVGESYEELSRRKRRIESELHALDLEEAAARQAENKKTRRETSDHKRKDTQIVHIKEEPLSDEDVDPVRSNNRQDRSANERNERRKHHSSRSSGDEKSWGQPQMESKKDVKVKEKPNLSVSGKLAEDTNTFNGVVIKYNEPGEARKPRRRWRLYPFKGDSDLPFIPIHRQSAYLFGRTRSIADIPIDHPSCSKQHAVLQFRLVSYKREDGTTGKRVRPYIIDLESSNGTFVNNNKITPRCYVELMEKDVVKFGYSSREYVLLHEESKEDKEDDDVLELND